MFLNKTFLYVIVFILAGLNQAAIASAPMDDEQLSNVKRVEISKEADKQRISLAAGLLAKYEIDARKLIDYLKLESSTANKVRILAKELMQLSEDIISNTQFRLPQCQNYIEKTLVLKNQLDDISHDSLEKDFHHDGALPKAPVECYHTKDLFVHPATVIVLTRDDPSLNKVTKESITAEISEVLGHIELVRHLVIY